MYIKYKTEVFCKLQFEATHNWPTCPYDEVDYLRIPHRHVFHITAYKTVMHNDRDVEFIILKHRIQEFLETTFPTHRLGSMSCEMLAHELVQHFDLSRCEVSEDDENGAILTVE